MQASPTQKAQEIVKALGGSWHRSYGMVRCPAHNDRTPSLSIRPGDHSVIFHCFAGCTADAVKAALQAGKIDYRAHGEDRERVERKSDLRGLANEIWKNALPLPHTPALKYLRLRGINTVSPGRFDPAAITYEGAKKLSLAALIVPIEDSKGITAIQRIFLDRATGTKTKKLVGAKRTLGNPEGGAIRIGAAPDDILHLAEGLEDASSAMILNALPHCWAACGVERYGQLEIPDRIRKVVIWSQHGKEAANAIERATPHLTANDRQLEIYLPPPGGDWNDLLLGKTTDLDVPPAPSYEREILQTSSGKIWITRLTEKDSIRIWWPKNSPVGELAVPILLDGKARWNPAHKAWYAKASRGSHLLANLAKI